MLPSFTSLKFKFSWRSYQQKFLYNFSEHIADNCLHVIAPPGSGKTLLGLEILRQIGKKTIVFSPTLNIRNQWESRLQGFFTNGKQFEALSFDISELSDITFTTYQGLHAFYKKQESVDAFIDFFKNQGVETLVLDEAHHLQNEWWKCLYALKENLDVTIVSLTATPPYDSDRAEIDRYFKLCGEVDDEIPIPDLVKEGDLCPHQDFIHFSEPDDLTINYIYAFRKKVSALVSDLQTDDDFIIFIKNHPFYKNTESHIEDIYNNPAYFSSILIFLNAAGVKIQQHKLKLLGFGYFDKIEFTSFNNEWASELLNHLVFYNRSTLQLDEVYLKQLSNKLKRLGVLTTKRINLIGDKKFYQMLSTSFSKLNSIVDIIDHSFENLGDDLRAVILTDYIRKEFLALNNLETNTLDKIGVLTIFHKLRFANKYNNTIGILTGSLVVLSKQSITSLQHIFGDKSITTTSFLENNDFSIVTTTSAATFSISEMVTELFQKGFIKILIGTKSFLGEGWDAPSINTLVLASFVGSFVSSNQMRGRAIRSQASKPNKTAVIWHLACLDLTDKNGGKDYETLSRRFEAFMGTSFKEPIYIENGLERLDLDVLGGELDIKTINKASLINSKNRKSITDNWEKAIASGTNLIHEFKNYHSGQYSYQKQKKLYFKDIVLFGLIELVAAISWFLPEFLIKNLNVFLIKGAIQFFYILLSALLFGFGVKTYKVIRMYIYFGSLHKSMQKMGQAVLHTLQDLNYIKKSNQDLKVEAYLGNKGVVTCMLVGASDYESSVFVQTMQNLVDPIENPRYLLVKGSWLRTQIGLQRYLAVPDHFGDKKDRAMLFLKHWKHYVGSAKICYTRQKKGRLLLLKARLLYMTVADKKPSKKSVIWR